MDRLNRAFLIAATFVAINCQQMTPVSAQQVAQDSYVLAGDLANPLAHSYPAGTRLTVQQLLADGGLPAVQGTAVVLRGQPLTMATAEICPPSGPSHSLLPGDIVIFRSLQGWQGRQNVVRVSASSIEILAFDASSRFQLAQMFPMGAVPATVNVHRTGFGQSAEGNFAPSDWAQHGDVILTEFVPAVAASPRDTVRPASQPTTIDSANVLTIPGMASSETAEIQSVSSPADLMTNSTNNEAPFAVSPFDLPVETAGISTNNGNSSAAGLAAEPPPTPAEIDSRLDAGLSEDAIAGSQPTEAGQGAEALWNTLFVLGIVLALGLIAVGWVKTQQEQQREQQMVQESQQQFRTADITTNPAQGGDFEPQADSGIEQLSAFIPQANSMIADTQADKGTPFSLTETGASEADWRPPTTAGDSASQPDDLVDEASESAADDDTVVEDSCPVLSAGIKSSADVTSSDQPTAATTPAAPPTETDTSQVPAAPAIARAADTPLVSPTEWFGEDWRKPIIEEPLSSETQVAEIGLPEPPAATETPAATEPLEPTETRAPAAELNSPAETPTDLASIAEETSVPAVAAAAADDDLDDTEVEILRQRQATPPPEVLASFSQADVPGYSEPQPASEERQLVEDMIENRLPINLQQAELPLNVSLFGKPSGPQRLRIDSAHTEIAPPHMVSRSRKRKRTQPAAVADNTATPPTTSGGAGLDNALNYIDEQLDK